MFLGIFGRDSVDLACNWYANADFIFRDGAYQVFRNYDSKGAKFGDTSVSATATDPVQSSIYAATDKSNSQRLTVVVINKDNRSSRGQGDHHCRHQVQERSGFTC